MKRFCVIANADKAEALEMAGKVQRYLVENGCRCVDATKSDVTDANQGYADVSKIPDNTECIIILGGDGTIIHAASDIAKTDIPILGVNMGNLGYLADVELNEIYESLEHLMRNEYTINERVMINGIVMHGSSIIYEGRVLNDIVVGRNGFSRIIGLNVYVNGELTETLKGDGVIVATPTGSTGYNLSAGGPVIKPNANVMVITPICSHSMASTSIVVDAEDVIMIEVIESRKTQEQEVIASFDGSQGSKMGKGDILKISASHYTTKMVSTGEHGYFEVLQKKLH